MPRSPSPRPSPQRRGRTIGRVATNRGIQTLFAGCEELSGGELTAESAAYATPKAAEASPSPLQKGRGLLGVVNPAVLAVTAETRWAQPGGAGNPKSAGEARSLFADGDSFRAAHLTAETRRGKPSPASFRCTAIVEIARSLRKSVAAYRARSIAASALACDLRLSRIMFDGCFIRSG